MASHDQILLQFVYACAWWFLFFLFGRAVEGSVMFADTSMLSRKQEVSWAIWRCINVTVLFFIDEC